MSTKLSQPQSWRAMPKSRRRAAFCSLILAFVLNPALVFAAMTTTKLVPISYETTHGRDGAEPVSNMDVLDESGIAADPSKFVQFQARSAGTTYAGYQTFVLPKALTPASVVAIQVLVNYQGPAKPSQIWTWQIFDWVHNGFVTVGDNYFAPQSKPWTVLSFNIGGNNIADYVRGADHQIRLQTSSSNAAGDADIDYEALVVTSTSNPVPAGRSFFVSTTGLDTNPGTISAPFKTISKAATVATPGSTVYVRGGVYHERVVVQVSGTSSGGFIQFQSFAGENAIIDGTGVAMPPVVSTPTGLIQITDRNYIIFQGFEIRNSRATLRTSFPPASRSPGRAITSRSATTSSTRSTMALTALTGWGCMEPRRRVRSATWSLTAMRSSISCWGRASPRQSTATCSSLA